MRTYLLAVAAGAALAGCADDDEPATNPPNKQVKSAAPGESVSLRGRAGQKLEAKVVGVQDPVREHPFEDARVSGRYVGVELELTNQGPIRHSSSPWSGSRLSTSKGGEIPTKQLKKGSCLGTVNVWMAPGSMRRLCIPFRVEKDARLLKFRYTPHAGFAPTAAVWDLTS
jgi:hypothetical protein